MALNDIDHRIIIHMAKVIFATAWADYQDRMTDKTLTGEIMDQVPETPDYVLHEAYYQAGRLADANGVSLFMLFRKALSSDGLNPDENQSNEKLQKEFASGVILPMMGHGVHWFDDHATFALSLPDFEWSMYDLDNDTYPIDGEGP